MGIRITDKSGVQMVKTIRWLNGLLFKWHLNTGQKLSAIQMVVWITICYLNGIWIPDSHLKNGHLVTGQKIVCYLNDSVIWIPTVCILQSAMGIWIADFSVFLNGRVTQIPDTGVWFMACLFNFSRLIFFHLNTRLVQ